MKEDIREMPAGAYYSKGKLVHRKAYTRNYGVKNPKRKYTPKPMRVMIEGRKYDLIFWGDKMTLSTRSADGYYYGEYELLARKGYSMHRVKPA